MTDKAIQEHNAVESNAGIRLADYFQQHVIATITFAASIIGGAALTYHFYEIGFMPTVKLESTLLIFVVAGMVGISVLGLGLAFVLPGVFWAMVEFWPKGIERYNSEVEKTPRSREHPHFYKMMWLMSVSFSTAGWWGFLRPKTLGSCVHWLIGAVLAAAVVAYWWLFRTQANGKLAIGLIKFILVSAVVGLLGYQYLTITFNIVPNEWGLTFETFKFVFWSALILGFNFLVVRNPIEPEDKYKFISILVGVLLIIYFTIFNSFQLLIGEVITKLKLGNISNTTLILSKPGCQVLKALKLSHQSLDESQCKIDDVKVQSRIGEEYFIKYQHTQFTMAKTHVLSWSVSDKRRSDSARPPK